ncbi:MAG: phasin [Ideonella sp.]|nr:phasin [Ideonella sp.]
MNPRPTTKRKATPGKTPAKKTTAAKPKPKRAARARRPPAAEPAAATDAESLRELVARLGNIEMAGLAGRLVQGWRKDLQVIAQASQRSYEGLQAVVARQTAQIKEAAGELQTVGRVMGTIGAKQSMRNLDDLALASLKLALADIRELAELTASSQREAYELMHRRVTENIDDVQQLLRR